MDGINERTTVPLEELKARNRAWLETMGFRAPSPCQEAMSGIAVTRARVLLFQPTEKKEQP